MRGHRSRAVCLVLLLLLGARPLAARDAGAAAGEVDALLEEETLRGLAWSVPFAEVKERLPGADVRRVDGLRFAVVRDLGALVTADRDGCVASISICFIDSPGVPASPLATKDGLLRAGAGLREVEAYFKAKGRKWHYRVSPTTRVDDEGTPSVSEYLMIFPEDSERLVVELLDGRLWAIRVYPPEVRLLLDRRTRKER